MRNFAIIIFIFFFNLFSAQNRSFYYELSYMENPQKDSLAKKNYILDIKNQESVFRTVKEKEEDSARFATNRLGFTTTSLKDNFSTYKNLNDHTRKKYIVNFRKTFEINISEPINWTIKSDIKKIGHFNAQRAETSYGGREWIAWFTTEVPLSDGPYVFSGLPGLIIELYDVQHNFNFVLTQIKNTPGELYKKDNPLPISWKQYKKLTQDFYTDPTREINDKNSSSDFRIKWVDENGDEFKPNFKEMNESEQKKMRENNNPIELNQKIEFK